MSLRNHDDSTTANNKNTEQLFHSPSSVQPSLSEKLSIVNEWLTYDLLQQDIPPFEKNEVTIHLLYQLVLYSRKQSLQSNTLMNHYKQKIVEYQSESKRMEYLLKSLHLSSSSCQSEDFGVPNNSLHSHHHHSRNTSDIFSSHQHDRPCNFQSKRSDQKPSSSSPPPPPQQQQQQLNDSTIINRLAELASLLQLKKPSQSCFMDALYDLSNEHLQTLQESNELKHTIQDLSKKSIEHIQKTQYLNEIYQQFNQEIQQREHEDSLQERLSTIEYLKRKSQEYQFQITQLQQELDESLSIANDMDISQSFLIEMYHKIQNLKKEMTPKLAIIEKYHHLPPDVHQVKLEISNVKQELKQLEEIFNQKAQHIWFD
nr:unnamed protein product [Naegleria fowleri]